MTTIDFDTADARYGLKDLLHAWEDDESVQVLEPGAIVECIDLSEGSVVATGDLVVKGGVFSDDESGFLIVLGSMTAEMLLSGGGQIVVQGDLSVARAVHADYNHGHLHVRGALRAKVLIAEHRVVVDGAVDAFCIDFGGLPEDWTPDVPRKVAVYSPASVFLAGALNSSGYVDGPALAGLLADKAPVLQNGLI
jgi:hypothetical protein